MFLLIIITMYHMKLSLADFLILKINIEFFVDDIREIGGGICCDLENFAMSQLLADRLFTRHLIYFIIL
jgi:hypothetical protein